MRINNWMKASGCAAALVVFGSFVPASEASDIQPFKTVYATDVAYADLVPLADGEFVAVSIDWLEQSSERIHARRLRLVDTLFRDNYEYLAR